MSSFILSKATDPITVTLGADALCSTPRKCAAQLFDAAAPLSALTVEGKMESFCFIRQKISGCEEGWKEHNGIHFDRARTPIH